MKMRRLPLLSAALILFAPHPVTSDLQAQNQAPTTGILGAFSEEVALLEQSLSAARPQTIRGIRFVTGSLKGRRVVVVSSGVGKVNAAMSATLLIDRFKPSEVLYSGIAGAVNPDLRPGDIVIGQKCAQHDLGTLTDKGMQRQGVRNPVNWERNPVFLESDPKLLALAVETGKRLELERIQTSEGERSPNVVKGILVSGDLFIASPAKREELRRELGADAVEMEGAAVAQVCYELGVPFLIIRSISDSADSNARSESSLFTPVAAQNSAALVTALVQRLGSLPVHKGPR